MEIPRYFSAQATPSNGVPIAAASAPYQQGAAVLQSVAAQVQDYAKAAGEAEATNQYNRGIAKYRTGLSDIENSYFERFSVDKKGQPQKTHETMLADSAKRLQELEAFALEGIDSPEARAKFANDSSRLRAGTQDLLNKRQRSLFIDDSKVMLRENVQALWAIGDYEGAHNQIGMSYLNGVLSVKEYEKMNEDTQEVELTSAFTDTYVEAYQTKNTRDLLQLLGDLRTSAVPPQFKEEQAESIISAIGEIDRNRDDAVKARKEANFSEDLAQMSALSTPELRRNLASNRYNPSEAKVVRNLIDRRSEQGIPDFQSNKMFSSRIVNMGKGDVPYIEELEELRRDISMADALTQGQRDSLMSNLVGEQQDRFKDYRFEGALNTYYRNLSGGIGVYERFEKYDSLDAERINAAQTFKMDYEEWWLNNPDGDPREWAESNWEGYQLWKDRDWQVPMNQPAEDTAGTVGARGAVGQ